MERDEIESYIVELEKLMMNENMYPYRSEHSHAVAYASSMIADASGLNERFAYLLGLAHDIGYIRGDDQHPINGYRFLLESGFPETIANVCLTHSFIDGEPNCTADGIVVENDKVLPNRLIPYENEKDSVFVLDFLRNHDYTIYEKIINLTDLMCTNKVIGVEARLEELISRKGRHENTQYHTEKTMELKKFIESIMNAKLEEIMPEINSNDK